MITFRHSDPVRCAEKIIDSVGHNLVLGIPNGIGKPMLLVNALYRIVEADFRLKLKIFTGLTLVRPDYRSSLERRFIEPLLQRLFPSYPDPLYVEAQRRDSLPRNIEVHEFFVQAGAWLAYNYVQRNYVSLNYTHVAGHLIRLGANVLAQAIAPDPAGGTARISLSSNTDITLDIMPYIAARRIARQPIVVAGEINANLPYMPGDAEVDSAHFDIILEPESPHYDLFAPPKRPLSLSDYAMALNVAPLIKDGGTLQIGIGSFADALAYVLILRHTNNPAFRNLVERSGMYLPNDPQLDPFAIGLYGCSEMFVEALLALKKAGILRRRVSSSHVVQPSGNGVEGLEGRGPVLHAGFFVGSQGFYRDLRAMPREERADVCMTSISFINALYGDEALKRAQRNDARFVNTAMTATLLGAVSSDQLEDGRVVSGVGGQHDFVVMAHELAGARSIIALRSTRRRGRRTVSNIVWRYANTTIPRHLRDIVVTEYGIADLRGEADCDVVVKMLKVADSLFQPSLQKEATRAGKLQASFALPSESRTNRPERIIARLGPARAEGLLPVFPFGSEMTPVEQRLIEPLEYLNSAKLLALARTLSKGLSSQVSLQEREALERMELLAPNTFKGRILRMILLGAMRQ
jgi:acyl-CoA hydrolase